MVSDQDRRDLYDVLEQHLGQAPAGTLMELLPPVGWGDVARQSDLVAVRGEMAEIRGEMAEIRGEIGELRGDLKGEIGELRGEFRGEMALIRGEMAETRGEIAKLSARVEGQIPRFIWANVPIAASISGLVLAVAKFA